jgi:hypothetical protein
VLLLINLPNGGELPFALIPAAVVGFTPACGRCGITDVAPPDGGDLNSRQARLLSSSDRLQEFHA